MTNPLPLSATATPEFHFTNGFVFAMLTEKNLMRKNTESIVVPPKIKNLNRSQALFIPADTPSKVIKQHLEKNAEKKYKFLFSHLYESKNKVILLGGVGSPAAVLAVEPLIHSGVKEIIALGFCGGLTEKINLFETFMINTAFSEEGTSSHYISHKKRFASSEILNKEMEQRLESKHIPYKKASIVSMDAPYRETKKWLADKKKKGIELVDMETSAVFALAEYYKIKAAALVVVSDVIKADSHQIGFLKPKLDDQIKQILSLFL